MRSRINFAEMAKSYHAWAAHATPGSSPRRCARRSSAGGAISAHDYLAALDWPGVLNAGLDELFERCDAILTPAATGTAPPVDGSGGTGDPIFNGLWTLCGTPAITLPLLEGSNGLPMGVQARRPAAATTPGCCAPRATWPPCSTNPTPEAS